jgi:hypothetical protein
VSTTPILTTQTRKRLTPKHLLGGFSLEQEEATMHNQTKDRPIITRSVMEKEFIDVGEDLQHDISAVVVTVTRDVHFDAYECEVSIYGSDGDAPVVCEIVKDLQNIADDERMRAGYPVDPSNVLSLFDGEMLGLLTRRDIRIGWNPEWVTEAEIDPATAKSSDRLYPEDQ